MTDGWAGARDEGGTLVGRDPDLAELARLAQRARLITLSGEAGIGKTWLARRLTAALAPACPGGMYLVGLADLGQPDLLAARVAAALGVSEEPGVPPLDTVVEALRGRRILLTLDHCEHLAGACAGLAERLLAGSPGLLIVATSRTVLGAAGELAWPVPRLTAPPASTAAPESPDRAARYDAVRLFAGRAAAAAPGFALSPGNCAAVAAICRALGGLPLAIELAAAWAPGLAADQIAARVNERLRQPADLDQPGAPPGRELRAALDGSHDLLSPDERVLFRRLSVLAGWSLETAERLCADDGLPASRIAGLLAGLAGKSLIEVEPGAPGQRRYRMPDAIREYAAGCLARSGESVPLRRRLRDYALAIGDYFLSIGLAQVPAPMLARSQLFHRYRTDADNVRAALAWCLEQGDIEAGLRLCTAFGTSWMVLSTVAEGLAWFGAFLSADQSGVPGAVRGPALSAAAWMASGGDEEKQAEAWAAEGLEVCRASGNSLFASGALSLLSQSALRAGRAGEALRHGTEAVEHARQCGDKWSEGLALNSCSAAQAALGQLPAARDSAAAALALMVDIDHQWGAARAALGLAGLDRAHGDLAAARDHYLSALALLRQITGDPEIARCLDGLGRVALGQGNLPEARGYLEQALELSRRAGSRSGTSRGLFAFAALTLREGRADRAVQLAAAAAALSEAPRPTAGARRRRAPATAPIPPRVRAQRYLDAAAGLGQAEVDRLWAAGLELDAAAAAGLALEPPS
ncbi:MAG TPA: tetratricopeptide repeat protein [Streptosporangiaceae bacterium]|jgi:predicted ATPase